MNATLSLTGSYQEALRAIGAWLDIRGYAEVKIVEESGELVIEAKAAARALEVFRIDRESLERLCSAAKNDRGSALSMPIAFSIEASGA